MKKKYLLFFCFVIILGIGCMTGNGLRPQKTVESVIETVADTSLMRYETIDLGKYTNIVRTRFGNYFTDEGFEQALAKRYFVCFFHHDLDVDKIEISEIELQIVSKAKYDVTFAGTFKVQYFQEEFVKMVEQWNISVRLENDSGKWLIRSMKLYQ